MDKNIYALKKLHIYRDSLASLLLIDQAFVNYLKKLIPYKDKINSYYKDRTLSKELKAYTESIEHNENYIYNKIIELKTIINEYDSKNKDVIKSCNQEDDYVIEREKEEQEVLDSDVLLRGFHQETTFRYCGIIDCNGTIYRYLDGVNSCHNIVNNKFYTGCFKYREFDPNGVVPIYNTESEVLSLYRHTLYVSYMNFCESLREKKYRLFCDSLFMDNEITEEINELSDELLKFDRYKSHALSKLTSNIEGGIPSYESVFNFWNDGDVNL